MYWKPTACRYLMSLWRMTVANNGLVMHDFLQVGSTSYTTRYRSHTYEQLTTSLYNM